MSTEIRDISNKTDVHVMRGMTSGVHFQVRQDEAWAYALVSRADFLAAVETECGVRCVPADAIVIEHQTLPGVVVDRHGIHADGLHTDSVTTYDDAMQEVWAWLAIAEHVKAHPPVPPVSDEDVETLAAIISAEDRERVAAGDNASWRDIARRLLATGRVAVTR